jgi:hypothetical protein
VEANTLVADLQIMDGKIRAKQREIDVLELERDDHIERLRGLKRFAINNLAGATYQSSLSSEMRAVAIQYRQKIDIAQRELRELIAIRERIAAGR